MDDVEKIVEVLENETLNTPVGDVFFGGEVLNGIGHCLFWPTPIYKVVGEKEYEIVATIYDIDSPTISHTVDYSISIYRGKIDMHPDCH